MSAYEIPLTDDPQRFSIELAGVSYIVFLLWNVSANAWVIDLYDKNENPILRGVPLVANVDLLEAYPHLNFGGQLIAQTDSNPNSAPTFYNLGTEGRVYFVTP